MPSEACCLCNKGFNANQPTIERNSSYDWALKQLDADEDVKESSIGFLLGDEQQRHLPLFWQSATKTSQPQQLLPTITQRAPARSCHIVGPFSPAAPTSLGELPLIQDFPFVSNLLRLSIDTFWSTKTTKRLNSFAREGTKESLGTPREPAGACHILGPSTPSAPT